jgi:hypothetical protein
VTGSGAATLAAVESGAAQLGEVGIFNIVTQLLGDPGAPDYTIVGTTFIQRLQYYVAAPPALAARGLPALANRTVGILAALSCDATLIPALVRRHGVEGVRTMPLSELGASWGDPGVFEREPSLAAATMMDPALMLGERAGQVAVVSRLNEEFPGIQWNGFVAPRSADAPMVRRYLEVYGEAVELMRGVVRGKGDPAVRATLGALANDPFWGGAFEGLANDGAARVATSDPRHPAQTPPSC